MSEHGAPIGPGPWQPTPGFFSSLPARAHPGGLRAALHWRGPSWPCLAWLANPSDSLGGDET